MAYNEPPPLSTPVSVANGGTGAATFATDGILFGNGTSAIGATAAGTNGQVPIGSTGSAPAFASITSGGGSIVFTAGANTLAMDILNYSNGTWTPTLIGSSTAGTTTYSGQNGYYTRITNFVFVTCNINSSAATGTGNVTFGGLPYTALNNVGNNDVGNLELNSAGYTWGTGYTQVLNQVVINTTTSSIVIIGSGKAANNLGMTNTSSDMIYNLFYQA